MTHLNIYSHEMIQDTAALEARCGEILAKSKLVNVDNELKKPEPYIFWVLLSRVILPVVYKQGATPVITYPDLNRKYSQHHMDVMTQMVDTCKRLNKRVILTSVPGKLACFSYKPGANLVHQQECRLISDSLGIEYFDGYEVFAPIPEKERPAYWLKHDGHWNSKGSDLYGEKISTLFLN
jgi:hypothetical protein